MINFTRRHVLKTIGIAGSGLSLGAHFPMTKATAKHPFTPSFACQQYTWFNYMQREDFDWNKDPEASVKTFLQSGQSGIEPSFPNAEAIQQWGAIYKKHKVWAKSMYVNSLLHEEESWEDSIKEVIAIARGVKAMGIEIVVTNPSPIKWGIPEDKNDQQITLQAKALNILGSELRKRGMRLAYHTHDMEMRQSAREFHHMMLHTEKENVHLCLDAHWIYRGAGNSQLALFDIIKLYGDRIIELHIRQSQDGIWSEVFGEGDIDYPRLFEKIKSLGKNPHMVFEQAIEKGSSQTMTSVEAITKGCQNLQTLLQA